MNGINRGTTTEHRLKEHLIEEAGREFRSDSTLSPSILLKLEALFEERILSGALQLLPLKDNDGRNRVCRIREPGSGRVLWSVRGSAGVNHTIFPKTDFCTCPAFPRVKADGYCKHVLAAKLSESMGIHADFEESAEQFVRRIVDVVQLAAEIEKEELEALKFSA